MEIQTTNLPGVLLIKANVFQDNRGYFFESFNARLFREAGLPTEFVQDNQSKSVKNTLRGLHFQAPPHAQGKLVRVIRGKVYDIVVDIRKSSDTYGQYYGTELSESNFHQLWIPEGFAHGFLTLEDDTIFAYKCTDFYNSASERGLMWNDKDLNIDWGAANPIISEKDKKNPLFKDFDSPFS
ncbi:MAG: dTDP-4-dehydrorhamnose 3,5-epimerase [Bacteroidia bacterium]